MLSFVDEDIRTIYPELIKRLDDSDDRVRALLFRK